MFPAVQAHSDGHTGSFLQLRLKSFRSFRFRSSDIGAKATSVCSPEEGASWLSRVLLWYIIAFTQKARKLKSAITLSDVPQLPAALTPETTSNRLRAIWRESCLNARPGKTPSLLKALFVLVRAGLLRTAVMSLFSIGFNLVLPIFSGAVVRAILKTLSVPLTNALVPAIFFCTFSATWLTQQAFESQTRVAVIAWGALTSLILEHPSKMTAKERARFSEGEVMNLLTTDCQAITDVVVFLGFYFVLPFQVAICSIILLILLGPPFLVGLVILGVNVWISERLGSGIKRDQVKKNTLGDQRSVLLNEALQGIRTVKLYSWERWVLGRVTEKRKEEMARLKHMSVLRGWQTFLSFGMPTLATVATFVVYNWVYDDLSADRTFTSVGLFEYLNMGMALIPNAVNEIRRLFLSVRRIGRFLASPASYVSSSQGSDGRVVVTNATFQWSEPNKVSLTKTRKSRKLRRRSKHNKRSTVAEPTPTASPNTFRLSNVNMTIKPGQLVAVVGRVGCGKSTFASGLLGLVDCTQGSVVVGGRTAFVPQQAFIMNDTFKNNILFGAKFDVDLYDQVIQTCALELDIGMLPSGDSSEVGEKGITISGGQKQRLAVARAAYAQPEVVVLDDPLSAMDAHVGRRVFEDCLLNGPLAKATRVLVTNQIQYCSQCDYVYVLAEGQLVAQGTHEELMRDPTNGGCEEYYNLARHVTGRTELVPETQPEDQDGADDSKDDDTAENEGNDDNDDQDQDAEIEELVAEGNTEVEVNATVCAEAVPQDQGNDEEQELHSEIAPQVANPPAVVPVAAPVQQKPKAVKLMTTEAKKSGRIGFGTFFAICRATESKLLGFLVVALVVVAPLAQYGVNLVLARWTEDSNNKQLLFLYLGMACLFGVIAGVRSVIFSYFFLAASENLHRGMTISVLSSPMKFFDTTPVGRVLNRFGGDVMQLDMRFPRLFEMWAYLAGMTIVIVFAAGVLVPHILVVSVILIGLSCALYAVIGAIVLEMRRLLMISYSPIMAFFSSYIYGLDSIRAFGRTEMFLEKFANIQSAPARCMLYMSVVQTFWNSIVLAFAIAAFFALLALSLILLRDTSFVTPGFAGLVLSYGAMLCVRLPAVFMITTMLEQSMSAVQRVVEYIDLDKEPTLGLDKVPTVSKRRAIKVPVELSSIQVVPEAWPNQGTIAFNDVTMAYRPNLPPVLKGVSFTVAAGEKIGVVGRTGAGKSSLIQAVFRIVETQQGAITIDGLDTNSVSLRDLRSRLGMIPQDPFLFSGTIRSNLDVEGTFTDDEIWNALRMANLEATVKELREGLQHKVSEKGDNFSAGTVQLLCLARVLLKKPKVIFMDEATASVDLETDNLVQNTIRSAFAECTIVTIAHRLNTVIDYDKILVMDQGKVVEFGAPAQLLRNANGFFSNLVNQTGASSAQELRTRAGL